PRVVQVTTVEVAVVLDRRRLGDIGVVMRARRVTDPHLLLVPLRQRRRQEDDQDADQGGRYDHGEPDLMPLTARHRTPLRAWTVEKLGAVRVIAPHPRRVAPSPTMRA